MRYHTERLDNRLAPEWLTTKHSSIAHIFNSKGNIAISLCGWVTRDFEVLDKAKSEFVCCKQCNRLLKLSIGRAHE